LSGVYEPPLPSMPGAAIPDISRSYELECPRCATPVLVTQVQGDRCPGCNFEFTVFEPGQDLVAGAFYDVLTGDKYVQELPDGGKVVVHG